MADFTDRLDWDRLIEERGDEEIIVECMKIFLPETLALLARLRAAVGEDNAKEFEMTAHTLKANLAMFFFDEAATLTEVLETLGRQLKKLRELGDSRERLTNLRFLDPYLDGILQPRVEHCRALIAAQLRGAA